VENLISWCRRKEVIALERERQARWDAAHLHTVSTRFRTEEYEAFRSACDGLGLSMYSVVAGLVRNWLAVPVPDGPRKFRVWEP